MSPTRSWANRARTATKMFAGPRDVVNVGDLISLLRLRAALFDLDETLIKSNAHQLETWLWALDQWVPVVDEHTRHINEQMKAHTKVCLASTDFEYFVEGLLHIGTQFGVMGEISTRKELDSHLTNLRLIRLLQLVDEGKIFRFPGVMAIGRLKESLKMAVVLYSANNRLTGEALLQRLFGSFNEELFQLKLWGSDLESEQLMKPDPHGWLYLMEQLDLDNPSLGLIFEDSLITARRAIEAGMGWVILFHHIEAPVGSAQYQADTAKLLEKLGPAKNRITLVRDISCVYIPESSETVQLDLIA